MAVAVAVAHFTCTAFPSQLALNSVNSTGKTMLLLAQSQRSGSNSTEVTVKSNCSVKVCPLVEGSNTSVRFLLAPLKRTGTGMLKNETEA